MNDIIYRQDAIDALKNMGSEDADGITVSRANVDSMLRYLPSAQPDQDEMLVICDILVGVLVGEAVSKAER